MPAGTPARSSDDDTRNYDAFISYSHADIRLSAALQSGLQRLGRPWYRRRATMAVFRDETGFAASEDLTESIRSTLEDARYLVLLLSPESAGSHWVDQEVGHWLSTKPKGRLIPVVTRWQGSGTEVDTDLAGFRWDDSDVPPSLQGYFTSEPLAVDLRWAGEDSDLNLRNERFTDAVAEIASPILGARKDELVGETIRLQRRARRLAAGAIVALAVLTVVSVVAGILAVNNAARAEARARLALSRQLAATAGSLSDTDTDLALLLAVEAFSVEETTEARGALLGALTQNRNLEQFLHSYGGAVNEVSFQGPSHLIGSNANGFVSVWNTETGAEVATVRTEVNVPLLAHAAHPTDGTVVAGDGDGGLHIVDTGANQETGYIPDAHQARINVLRFVDGGDRVMSAGDDGIINLWTLSGGDIASHASVSAGAGVRDLLVVEDEDVFVAALDSGGVRFWSLSSFELVAELKDHENAANALAWHLGTRRLATGGTDGRIIIYDVDEGAQVADIRATRDDLVSVQSLQFDPPGSRLFAGNSDGTVREWSAPEWVDGFIEVGGHSTSVVGLALSPDGRRLASSSTDGAVILRDITRSTVQGTNVTPPNVSAGVAAVSADGLLAIAGLDGPAVLNLRSGEWILSELSTLSREIASLGFSPDGTTLAMGTTDGDVIVWDVATDAQIRVFEDAHGLSTLDTAGDLPAYVWDVAVAADGSVVSAGVDGVVRLSTDEGTSEIAIHEGGALSVDVEGTLLASTGADLTVQLNDIAGASSPASFQGGFTVAVSPDGRLVAAVATDGGIELWDVGSERVISLLGAGAGRAHALDFSPDSTLLASGHPGGDVQLWDVTSGSAIGGPLRGHLEVVQTVNFHPNGDFLVSGAFDGSVIVWDLQPMQWLELACLVANRNLSELEWITHIGDATPYRLTCPQAPAHPFGIETTNARDTAGEEPQTLSFPDASRAPAPDTRPATPSVPPADGGAGASDGFAAGDCVNDPESGSEFTTVSCEQPHDNEVFAVIPYPSGDGTYPGVDEVFAVGDALCLEAFEPYVGEPYVGGTYEYLPIGPTAEAWDLAERDVFCIVYKKSFEPLVGSLRVSPP